MRLAPFRLRLGAALLLACLATMPIASGQDACKDILAHGVYDESLNMANAFTSQTAKHHFCSSKASSREQAHAVGLDAIIESLPIGFSAESESFSSYREKMCSFDWSAFFMSQHAFETVRQANENLIDAWKQCMARDGFQLSYGLRSNETFVVRMTLNGAIREDLRLVEPGFSMRPDGAAQCDPLNPYLGRGLILNCQRVANVPISIVVNTNLGNRDVEVLPLLPTNPAPLPGKSATWKRVANIHAAGARTWGSWSSTSWCPDGTYAVAFRAKIEGRQGDGQSDDTAMNGLQLICRDPLGGVETTIVAAEERFGGWTEWARCPPGYALASYSLRSEPPAEHDDTAANGIRFGCRSIQSEEAATPAALRVSNEGYWGAFGQEAHCPARSAICAFQSRVQPYKGRLVRGGKDDTSLNDVQFECCGF